MAGVAVLGGILVIGVRTWVVQGLFLPIRVSGGSMAEALKGSHFHAVCGGCGFAFDFGSDPRGLRRRAICPNCAAENAREGLPEHPGQRMLLLKWPRWVRGPRRWELVALGDPLRASRPLLKRVAGLPGETIEVRDGDVYADNRLVAKSLAAQRAMAVLVHDARFGSRWRAERGWNRRETAFDHSAASGSDDYDWLTYRHQRRALGELVESPVLNELGYNQFEPPADTLVPVADLMLSLRASEVRGAGELAIRADIGRAAIEVQLRAAARRYVINQDGQRIAEGECPEAIASKRGIAIELSLFDGQLLLALDGRTAVARPLGSRAADGPGPEPFSIGARGEALVTELRVWRDVYYLPTTGGPTRLGADEFYMLGDNSLVSIDSRAWPGGGGLNGEAILGYPLRVP
jgi:type IV secretory pathway protease TraF